MVLDRVPTGKKENPFFWHLRKGGFLSSNLGWDSLDSENEFPGPLGPGAPKVQNGVEKALFDSFLDFREAWELIFELFLQLSAR